MLVLQHDANRVIMKTINKRSVYLMDLYEIIITTLATVEFGVIAFFLKDYYSESKKKSEAIKNYATKVELCDVKTRFEKELDIVTQDIKDIKNDYITKDDFYRYANDTNDKLNMIIKLLLKQEV